MTRELFKSDRAFNRCLYLHPIALLILWDMWAYCFEHNLEFKVTETVTTLEEDMDLGRLSSTHRSARAFDLRNRSWSLWDIKRFENHFKDKYNEKYGAIDSNGKRRLIVSVKHGSGPHFHVQIDRKYSIDIDYKSLDQESGSKRN